MCIFVGCAIPEQEFMQYIILRKHSVKDSMLIYHGFHLGSDTQIKGFNEELTHKNIVACPGGSRGLGGPPEITPSVHTSLRRYISEFDHEFCSADFQDKVTHEPPSVHF